MEEFELGPERLAIVESAVKIVETFNRNFRKKFIFLLPFQLKLDFNIWLPRFELHLKNEQLKANMQIIASYFFYIKKLCTVKNRKSIHIFWKSKTFIKFYFVLFLKKSSQCSNIGEPSCKHFHKKILWINLRIWLSTFFKPEGYNITLNSKTKRQDNASSKNVINFNFPFLTNLWFLPKFFRRYL